MYTNVILYIQLSTFMYIKVLVNTLTVVEAHIFRYKKVLKCILRIIYILISTFIDIKA